MKSENFADEQDIRLIEFVRNHKVLYQTKHRSNLTALLKENLWLELASSLNKEGNFLMYFYSYYLKLFINI